MKKTESFLLKLGRAISTRQKNAGSDSRAPIPLVAKELSALTGKNVSPGTVHRWCDRDTISFPHRPNVARLAIAHQIPVPKSLVIFVPAGDMT